MRERPILFQGAMVRALLAGTKTQTRRVVKGTAREWLAPGMFAPEYVASPANGLCPYGFPGDRLWVRETWAAHWMYNDVPPSQARCGREDLRDTDNRWYRSDGETARSQLGLQSDGMRGRWRPAIHMPRWACRLVLDVMEVRIERLQDISRGDAMAEGCPFPNMADGPDPRQWYAELWDSINGATHPWSTNPWVWVIGFRRAAGEAS